MSTTTARDLHEFVAAADSFTRPASHDRPTVFRGMRDSAHDLLPGIARFPFEAPEAFRNAVDDHSESAERILYVFFRDYCAAIDGAFIAVVRARAEVVTGFGAGAGTHRACGAHDRGSRGKRSHRGATRRGSGRVSREGFTVVILGHSINEDELSFVRSMFSELRVSR